MNDVMTLVRELEEDGAQGADLSPGNPVSARAAALLRLILDGNKEGAQPPFRPVGGNWFTAMPEPFVDDQWWLARAKLLHGEKYYGAYLGGFPERARIALGVSINDPVLHVCGGKARFYPYPTRAIGPNDRTLDLNPDLLPDFLQDARDPYPEGFEAHLADPPYSEEDAKHYLPGKSSYPAPTRIVENSMDVLKVGQRMGIIHYLPPSPPKGVHFVGAFSVWCGFNNRIRAYSVYEKG